MRMGTHYITFQSIKPKKEEVHNYKFLYYAHFHRILALLICDFLEKYFIIDLTGEATPKGKTVEATPINTILNIVSFIVCCGVIKI